MKNRLFAAALLLAIAAAPAYGQAPKAFRITADDTANPPAYALPYTTVKVKVELRKEIVKTGPYARFAQKYLGTIAPLNDVELYTVTRASLDYTDPDRELVAAESKKYTSPVARRPVDPEFAKLLPDRLTSNEKGAEEMAREAANMIFKLRRTRIDLITGEIGEHVYGAGLEAALDEITRLENEYTSLFLGKRSVTTVSRQFDIIPDGAKTSYVVCRYSETEGFLSESDLSGDPVVLMLSPLGTAGMSRSDNRKGVSYYRVADWVSTTLMDGARELDSKLIPIYQFGATVPGK